MKKIYPAVLFFILSGCIKEKKAENLVIQAMVNGQWKVTSYIKAGTDVTSGFAPYSFQFKTNFTVDAINNGSIEQTGTWTADASSQTISSNFSNATEPLLLLNGTWLITNNSWTWVEAKQSLNGELRTLRLDKQ